MSFAKILPVVGLALVAVSTNDVQAAPVNEVAQIVNTLQADAVPGLTDNLQLTVDVAGPVAVAPGKELLGFAFGTYDVDVSANSLTMTFVNDPNALAAAIYDSTTFDRYYIEFDTAIDQASIDASTNSAFSAMVEVVAPGTSFAFDGALVPGLATDISMANGGLLITIGDGTNLFDVGVGGTLTVNFSAVPLPATFPLLVAGIAGAGWLGRRSQRKAMTS